MYNVEQASPTTNTNSWYTYVHQYFKSDIVPSYFSSWLKRALKLKELSYQLVHGVLFKKHHNRVLLRCLEAHDLEKVLCDLHDGPAEGHFAGNTKTHKVMRVEFYWPTLFKDSHAYAHKCPVYQRYANITKKSAALVQPIVVEEPFQ